MNTTLVTTTGAYSNFDPSIQFMEEDEYDFTVEMLAGSFADPEAQPTIFVVDVVAPAHDEPEPEPKEELVPFTPPMPCYLVDLRSLEDSDMNVIWDNRYFIGPINGEGPGVNGTGVFFGLYALPFNEGGEISEESKTPWVDKYTFLAEFDTGTVNQIGKELMILHLYPVCY